MKNFLTWSRSLSRVQRRVAVAVVVALLVLCPSLPPVVLTPAATVAVWGSAQPVLVGMALGAFGLHRYRKAGGR